MTLIKIGVFMSMLLITPMLVAQNATLSLWEENLEQLSADEEERNWRRASRNSGKMTMLKRRFLPESDSQELPRCPRPEV
jgi:hypothetical protein